MPNPCQSPAAGNLFRKIKIYQWTIFDKGTFAEAIFRTLKFRKLITLEFMARRGMRISEVPCFIPADIENQKLLLHSPKSERARNCVYSEKTEHSPF
jgi:hypothetical protein